MWTELLVGLAQRLHDGDVHALSDHINKFFQQVAADLHPLSDSTTPPPLDVSLSEFVIAVERKLSQINVYKAPGPDDLPNWILRNFCTQFSGPVCAIFNASVREGTTPAWWKEANVNPVPKAHPPQLIESDLHQVSPTATLSKLLESFVGSWILDRIQVRCPSVWSTQESFHDSRSGGSLGYRLLRLMITSTATLIVTLVGCAKPAWRV